MKITSFIERDPESGMYIATVPAIPGAHTCAASLDELQKNLQEVVSLCLEEMDNEEKTKLPEFVGVQQWEFAID